MLVVEDTAVSKPARQFILIEFTFQWEDRQ